MSESRYVQHVSRQGARWAVVAEQGDGWTVRHVNGELFALPTSEYRLCDPPERWVDVTEHCKFVDPTYECHGVIEHKHTSGYSYIGALNHGDYRLRKVQVATYSSEQPQIWRWAFLVERKEP